MVEAVVPAQLVQIRSDFLGIAKAQRLQLLLEFSNELPPLPPRYADHPDLFERVAECQSPVFIFVDVDSDRSVHVFAIAPEQSPTTRGFASILVQGLDGLSVDQVMQVPDDFAQGLGLAEAVSALRLRGMTGMLARIKRQVLARTAIMTADR